MVLISIYFPCSGHCESNYEQRNCQPWQMEKKLKHYRQMGIKLKARLESTEWHTVWKEKQTWEKKKGCFETFPHANVPLNMKHHTNLEGKCTKHKMEIAEWRLQIPPLVIEDLYCQSFVMLHWNQIFAAGWKFALITLCPNCHMIEQITLVRHHLNCALLNIHICSIHFIATSLITESYTCGYFNPFPNSDSLSILRRDRLHKV